jgi:hypothetical protein
VDNEISTTSPEWRRGQADANSSGDGTCEHEDISAAVRGNVTDEVIAMYIAEQNVNQDEDFRVDG